MRVAHLFALAVVPDPECRILLLEPAERGRHLVVLGASLQRVASGVRAAAARRTSGNERTLLILIAKETTAGGTNMDVSEHRVPVVNVSPLWQLTPNSAAISPDLRQYQ